MNHVIFFRTFSFKFFHPACFHSSNAIVQTTAVLKSGNVCCKSYNSITRYAIQIFSPLKQNYFIDIPTWVNKLAGKTTIKISCLRSHLWHITLCKISIIHSQKVSYGLTKFLFHHSLRPFLLWTKKGGRNQLQTSQYAEDNFNSGKRKPL